MSNDIPDGQDIVTSILARNFYRVFPAMARLFVVIVHNYSQSNSLIHYSAQNKQPTQLHG